MVFGNLISILRVKFNDWMESKFEVEEGKSSMIYK